MRRGPREHWNPASRFSADFAVVQGLHASWQCISGWNGFGEAQPSCLPGTKEVRFDADMLTSRCFAPRPEWDVVLEFYDVSAKVCSSEVSGRRPCGGRWRAARERRELRPGAWPAVAGLRRARPPKFMSQRWPVPVPVACGHQGHKLRRSDLAFNLIDSGVQVGLYVAKQKQLNGLPNIDWW